MNLPKHLFLLGVAAVLAGAPARAQMPTPPPPPIDDEEKQSDKKDSILLLDGKTLFGRIEMTDDYTLRISNDSGLMKIPLALLGEKDFKKYTSQKDRSNDGRLWSERKDALEKENAKESASNKKSRTNSAGDNAFEIQLKELAVFQPAIDAYQQLLGDKKSAKSDGKQGDKTASKDDPPFIPLFSQPSAGQLPGPLNAVSGYLEPVTSVGGTAVDATAGAGIGLPSVPTP